MTKRTLWLATVVTALCAQGTNADDIDLERLQSLARNEQAQLVKCFGDMLTLVKRYNLREQLQHILYEGCAAERRALSDAVVKSLPAAEKNFAKGLAGAMSIDTLTGAVELYKAQPVSVCAGDSCVLGEYRKCLLIDLPIAASKRVPPSRFEQEAQERCRTHEARARGVLTVEFANAQKLQIDPQLSKATREELAKAVKQVLEDAVVDYGSELARLDPTRSSCEPDLCDGQPCLYMYGAPPTRYECMVSQP
ncbi:hypothetical protein GIW81_00700 [Hyphomicrobium sp. xq]|uniref:Uncharacterized protein n=1 Tax=Hyphomicrobium album TaxID=2665159 RepID=A0A6I3KE77_9HYPH|nr:hypothetical protein [Hyphomicrobium album]MTD92848.1 hypothetical protein [Hyphomicrobium album]